MTPRIMDRPEDYKKLGINPHQVELWEDGRRNPDTSAGNWEWWYFDAIMDDGTKVVVQFFTKSGMKKIKKNGDSPSITLKITLPDGTHHQRALKEKPENCTYGTDQCDVHFGEHLFVGDFQEYHIYVAESDGLGADLKLVSKAKPYRPGTAYFTFDETEFYTWLCAVPQGEVSGTLTINGKKVPVHGAGYHDHQWGNRFFLPEWNHWLWARQSFEDYSVLVFDFVTSEDYGNERFPIVFIQDQNGSIVFESHSGVKSKVLGTYRDDASGKEYPAGVSYEFRDGSKVLTYQLTRQKVLEAQGLNNIPFVVKLMAKKMKLDVAYSRFFGHGVMKFSHDGRVDTRTGDLIYEFMYPGNNCRELMERELTEDM